MTQVAAERIYREQDVVEALEALVDRHGLLMVATGLELMCAEKADHVRTSWQDCGLARLWDKAGRACRTLAERVAAIDL